MLTGSQAGGKKQLVKCLKILEEQVLDLENLSDKYKYSQDLFETILFNKFLGKSVL